jgi:RsiW-degrading membrane proteinase PrsW (M82 family)
MIIVESADNKKLFMNDPLFAAKQGDASAIAALLNRYFQPQGVTATAEIQNDRLQIVLESAVVPDQATAMQFIRQELSTWQPQGIKTVQVSGRQSNDSFFAWEDTLSPSAKSDFFSTLKTFKFAAVVPYQDVFSAELYSSTMVKLLLFFGLFPLVVSKIVNPSSLEQTAWLVGIYYASIWGIVLFNLIKPPQFDWSTTVKCVLFTAFVGIPLLLFFQHVPPFRYLYAAIESRVGLIPRLVGFVFGVGILEETCKALPIYLFLLRPKQLQEPLTGAFYGAMSGLGFAIAEGGTYSILYALGLRQGEINFSDYVLSNTIRFVSLPLFHAMLAGIVGYFIGLAAINRSRQWAVICIGIAISAVLHGSYNTFSDTLIGIGIIAFTILLFVAYLRRSQQMVADMQAAERDYP